MSRDFVGTGHTNPTSYDVSVEHEGQSYSIRHKVRGVFVDFQWDGGGPGSTDLARSLLWNVTGVEPEWRTYRLFKNEVVAAWPKGEGECWRISEVEIRQWLDGVERDTALTESPGQTEARQQQTKQREARLSMFQRLVGRK